MTSVNRTTLYTYFQTGLKPTQAQFTNLIDSNLNLAATGAQAIISDVSALGSLDVRGAFTVSGAVTFGSLSITNVVSAATFAATSAIKLNGTSVFNKTVEQVFTSTGTYTPTTGMIYCIVRMAGGGAGGGGAAANGASNVSVGGGGGAGEYAEGVFTAAQVGASQAVTIGAAGTAGSSAGGTGGSGGTTSLGALLTAIGGTGGGGGGTSPSITLTAGGAGGTGGTGGSVHIPGSQGLFGFGFATLNLAPSGGGAASLLGSNVNGLNNQAGNTGNNYGSGGGGASSTNSGSGQTGGVGTKGLIIVTEFISS